MQAVATTKGVRIAPRKVRLVADAIRNMPVDKALQALVMVEKRAAGVLTKTIKSAVANAVNNAKADPSALFIQSLQVQAGAYLKRYHMAARGRVRPYTKRSSHITVVVSDEKKGEGK